MGWRKPEQTRVDLHGPLESKGIQWVADTVTAIDAPASQLTLAGGQTMKYDYLVIATGPKLAFEEVPGLGPAAFTQSVCTYEHALRAWERYQDFLKAPGPVIVGAAPGASCFGPAYELAMILDTDLRKRRLRDKVPITFVTSEPYLGHLGLGGVADSKNLMESEFRKHEIKWIANAKITGVTAEQVQVTEVDEGGAVKREHGLPYDTA